MESRQLRLRTWRRLKHGMCQTVLGDEHRKSEIFTTSGNSCYSGVPRDPVQVAILPQGKYNPDCDTTIRLV